MTQRSDIARCLGISEDQLSYPGADGGASSTALAERVGSLAWVEAEVALVMGGIAHSFELLERLVAVSYPFAEEGVGHQVTSVNHEAGDHAMPQDAREIAIALHAGEIAWVNYPYLEFRFGERGRRFTRSDSCWLVTLTRMPRPTTTRNLTWLRTVLATRGIPSLILESHLRVIALALRTEFGEGSGLGERFDPFLSALDRERQTLGGAEMVTWMIEESDRRLRDCSGTTVDSAAALLASAWQDERGGIPGALAATAGWMTDPDRFSTPWISEVHHLLTALDRPGELPC